MEEELYKETGKRIRSARTALGLTQDELSKKVDLTRTSVTNIEQGRQVIQIHLLYKFAKALDILPKDLLPAPDELTKILLEKEITADQHLTSDEAKWLKSIKKKRSEG